VNFFGHAAVAARLHAPPPPGVALGAMLPDFASMCGARPTRVDDEPVARGVELHHATDAAFHRLASFAGLVRDLTARLDAAGVARGPARGAAHAGVELLLDGVLVEDAAAADAYLAALDHDPAGIAWPDGGGERFAILRARLRDHGVPHDLQRPEVAARRLVRALAHRPLLAPSSGDADRITRTLAGFARRVRVAAPTVLGGLAAALAPSATPGAPWHPGSRAGSSAG